MSPIYTCYFPSKNYFLSQAHFSDSVLIMTISWGMKKNFFLLPYMCLWLKHLQGLTNIYIFKYKLVISLTEIRRFQRCLIVLKKAGQEVKLSPLTIGLFEMHFLKNKSIVKMLLMQVILSGTVCMLSREQWWRYSNDKKWKKYQNWKYNREYLDDCVTTYDWIHSESSHLSTYWTEQEHSLEEIVKRL